MPVDSKNIWEEFGNRLKAFILKRVRNAQDAEDILQDTFFRIHSNLHTLRDKTKLETWIYQVTRNAVTDHYRKRHIPVESVETIEHIMDESPVIQDIEPDVEGEVSICLRPMINLLPPKYRDALVLTEFEGLTQKELAKRLGLSLSGAKSRVQRAKKKLKGMLIMACDLQFDHLGNIAECCPNED